MPEWSNGADSKSVVLLMWDRGFESLFLRKTKSLVAQATGLCIFGAVENSFS